MENSSERLVISIPEISLHCPAPWASGRWARGKHKVLEISDIAAGRWLYRENREQPVRFYGFVP